MNSTWPFLVLFLAAGPSFAGEAEKPVRPAAKALARNPAGVAGPQGGVAAFERVLTDDQRRKLREAMQENASKTRATQQEAIKLRRELQEAVLNGEAGEAVIKQRTEAIAKLEAEALAARMTAIAAIAGTLTPEQKEKIKEMSGPTRPLRSGLGAGSRAVDAPRLHREPAAPPPPEK